MAPVTHGRTATPTYTSWVEMRRRCRSPRHARHHGRGITVCERWNDSFEAFLADMGERPDGTSIDRIDNAKGYEPGNCRWADRTTQRRNQDRTKLGQADVEWIRAGDGLVPHRLMADALGVTQTMVSAVARGEFWEAS